MSRLSIIGLETGDLAEFDAVSGDAAVSTTVKTGDYSIALGSSGNASRTITPSSSVYLAFHFRFANVTGGPSTFSSIPGAQLYLNSSRTLRVLATGGTAQDGTTVLAVDTWYFIEFRCTTGTGSNAIAEVRLNGSVEATSSDGTSTGNITSFGFNATSFITTPLVDNIRADDSAYPGEGFVVELRPNAVGDETGATGTFADIDDDPINDTTVRTENAGPAFVDNLTTIASVGTINFTKVGVRASRSNGAGRSHFIRVKKGASTENSGDLVLDTVIAYYEFLPTQVPTSQSELDAYQAGMSQSASGGRLYNCAEVWVMVDHTPAAAAPRLIPILSIKPGFSPAFLQ